MLEAQGLRGTPDPEFSDTAPKGTVFEFAPGAGTRVPKGSVVTYTVSKGQDLVSVPDGIVGAMQDKADAALKAADLTPAYAAPQYDDEATKGQVLSATVKTPGEPDRPATGGLQVKRKSEVELVVANGPTPTTVTSVVGTTVDAATQQLAVDKLKLNVADEQFNDAVPAGQIITQDPPSGTGAHHGDTVNVVVSKGPEPIPLKNYIGSRASDAQAELEGLGFTVNVVKQSVMFGHYLGLVNGQSPDGGKDKTAPHGSTITLYTI